MADEIELSPKQLADIEKYLKERATLARVSVKDLTLSKNNIREMAKEIAQGTYKAMQKSNKVLSTDIGKALINATKSQISESNSFLGKLSNPKWLFGQDTSASGLQAIRTAEKVSSGLDDIFSGKLLSGSRELASAFPKVAKLISSPFAMAIMVATKAIIAFDKHLTEVNKNTLNMTGGFQSSFMDKNMAERGQFYLDIKESFRKLNNIDKLPTIQSFALQNLSTQKRLNSDVWSALNYGSTALTSLGVSDNTSLSIIAALTNREKLSYTQSNTAIKKMTDRISGKDLTLSDARIMDETLKGYEANKKFNLSMDWVNRNIVKYNDSLEKGTRLFEDFAAIQKTFYGGDTGQLAGLGNLIAQNAMAAGVELPTEVLNNLNNPYALKMLMSDPSIMKKLGPALQVTAKNMTVQAGFSGNELAEQGFLGDLLSQLFKVNVSRQAVIDLQRNNYDFEKTGLLGTGSTYSVSKKLEDQKNIEDISTNFEELVKSYQEATTTITSQLTNAISGAAEKITQEMKNVALEENKQRQENFKILMDPNSSSKDKLIAISQNMVYMD